MAHQSNMLELGTLAPEISLENYNPLAGNKGDIYSLFSDNNKNSDKKGYLVAFICNHCPYVKHINVIFSELSKKWLEQSIEVVAISSNDVEKYPDDSPQYMELQAREHQFLFPYLYDETQFVAKAYLAACTPDFFLFDADKKLYYRGQLDDSRPKNGLTPNGESLNSAIEQLISGQAYSGVQKPSLGCNIKWKSGNEPIYFFQQNK